MTSLSKQFAALYFALVGGALFVNPPLGFFALALFVDPKSLLTISALFENWQGFLFLGLIIGTLFDSKLHGKRRCIPWAAWATFWLGWTIWFLLKDGSIAENAIFWAPHLVLASFSICLSWLAYAESSGQVQDRSGSDPI